MRPQHAAPDHAELLQRGKRQSPADRDERVFAQLREHRRVHAAHQEGGEARVEVELAQQRLGLVKVLLGAPA